MKSFSNRDVIPFKNFMAVVVLASLSTFSTVHASLLKNGAPAKIIEKVQTHQSVEAQVNGKPETLSLVGAAIRTRKIIVHINVYIGEYFKNETTQAIRLSFLRDVDAEKIMGAFKDSLKVNKVDITKPGIKKFLDAVEKAGESTKNSTLVILGSKTSEGQDQIAFENGKGVVTTITESPGLVQDIFSIWLGTASDDGLLELQKAIKK